MAATCSFLLNGEQFSRFKCSVGEYTAFSGNGNYRNKPGSESLADDGAIPPGRYYIVDRPTGGRLGGLKDWLADREDWFALFADDGSVDDTTFVDYVSRGQFRLHPLGRLGMSTGCVVLQYRAQFNNLKRFLLAEPVSYVPTTSIRSYGTLDVTFMTDTLDPRFRNQQSGAAVA